MKVKELVSQLNKVKIERTTVHDGIKWNFNPPVELRISAEFSKSR